MSDERSSTLRRAAVSGARWTALGRLVVEVATFLAAIVLARLITPAGFGHAAVALIVVSVAAVLGTAGVVSPLVQREELLPAQITSTAFLVYAAGAAAAASTVVFALVAAPAIFGEPTSELLAVSSLAWLFVALGAPSQALLQRELRFRVAAGIDAVAAITGIAASLVGAAAGLEGGAVVLGALALAATTSLLSVAAAPPPPPIPTRAGVSEVYRFASGATGSSLVYLGYRNVDYAILGAQASAAQVGIYWRAYQLGVAYQGKISRVMLRVSLPIFSRATTLEELQQLRVRIVRTHATVLIPLLATFVGVAPVLVPWLFGPSWEPAVVPAQIMAVAGMADAVTTGVGPLMLALGHTRQLLIWNGVQLVAFTGVVLVLASHGTTALAIGVAAFGVFNVVGIQVALLRPYAGLPLRRLWRDIRAGCTVGFAALVVTVGIRTAVGGALPDIVLLLLLGAVALAAAAAVLRLAFREEADDIVRVLGRGRRAPDGASQPRVAPAPPASGEPD
jgi:PST family polysaccharide transporter/lipopolysaccharide exporter